MVSNIAPALCSELHRAWVVGNDPSAALALHQKLMPLHTALFCEASPGPVKYAASLLGIAGPQTRQPLVEIANSSKRAVEAALKAADLI